MEQAKMIHMMIRVADLDKSLTFYQAALGFRESRRKEKPEEQSTLVYLKGEDSDFELELFHIDGVSGPYDLGSGYGHLAVQVPDLEAIHARHVAAGYEVSDFHGLESGFKRYYFLKDPDGYEIEVMRIE